MSTTATHSQIYVTFPLYSSLPIHSAALWNIYFVSRYILRYCLSCNKHDTMTEEIKTLLLWTWYLTQFKIYHLPVKCKLLSHAKPLPSCPYFMVNITLGAVCCCMYDHSLDTRINHPLLLFKVLDVSIIKTLKTHTHTYKTSKTDYRPILL